MVDQPVGEMVAPAPVVEAVSVTGATATPEPSVCAPGLVTVTTLSTVHGKGLVVPVALDVSDAVTTTDDGVRLPVVGVPVMIPVEGSMVRPAGRPVAA